MNPNSRNQSDNRNNRNNNNRRGNFNKGNKTPVVKEEPTEAEVQKQIRETLEKLQENHLKEKQPSTDGETNQHREQSERCRTATSR